MLVVLGEVAMLDNANRYHLLDLNNQYAFAESNKSNKQNIKYWLADLRTQLIRQFASQYTKERGLVGGEEFYVSHVFYHQAQRKRWNILINLPLVSLEKLQENCHVFYPMSEEELNKISEQFENCYAREAIPYVVQCFQTALEDIIKKFNVTQDENISIASERYSARRHFMVRRLQTAAKVIRKVGDTRRIAYFLQNAIDDIAKKFNDSRNGNILITNVHYTDLRQKIGQLLQTVGLEQIALHNVLEIDGETHTASLKRNFVENLTGMVFYGFHKLGFLSDDPVVIKENGKTVSVFKQSLLKTLFVRAQWVDSCIEFTNAQETYKNKLLLGESLIDKQTYIKNIGSSGEDGILQEILDEFEYYPDLCLEAIFINALLTQRRQDGGILKTVAMRLSKKAWAMAGREKLRMRLLVSSLMRGEIIDYLAEDPSNLYRILLVQDAFSGVMKNLWGQVKCRGELKLLNSFMNALFILREDNHSVITGPSKKLWGALIKFIAAKLTPAQWFQPLETTYCSGETLYLVLMDIVFQELSTNLNDLAKKLTKEAPPKLLAQVVNSLVLWFIDDLFISDKDYEYIDSLAQLVAARVPDTDKAWANLSKEKDILERLLCTAQRNVQQGGDKKGLMCFVENTLRHACAEILQELLEDDVVDEPFKSMLAKRLESSSGQAEKSQSGLLRSPTLFNINKKSEAHQDSHHTLSLAY